jgi:glucosylceramidase
LWAVTVQNEPEFPAPWEACAYTPKAQADFVAYHLGPQLQEDHPDVKLLMFDHNKDHMITWAKLLLNKTAHPAHKYIQGTAYHWYAGGMDRLLDGSVGSPNLHRFQATLEDLFQNKTKKHDDHVILGSEACHCPYTGYAGGDIETYWARAERYAHSILADLAAGSNGWVEWNLVLDSVGGPNHLNNLCDTGILAVPHRAIVNETKSTIPPTLSFEKTNHSFGVNVGDSRTRAELNALGFPAKFLDDGLAVQPIYYYMGHISRYVRPGSRALQGLVEEAKAGVGKEQEKQAKEKYRAFRSPGQVVAGGGFNDIARNGIELTAWPCEGSTRQVFEWTSTKRIDVLGHDWLGKPTKSCVAREVDVSFKGVTLTDCKARLAATFDLVEVPAGEYEGHVKFVQTNVPRDSELSNRCLVLGTLGNGGGALGPRGGAQVMYGSCASPGAMWKYEEGTRGEITSSYLEEGEVCMTTGWPFLQMGAFSTPNGESDNTVVLLNEARDSANYVLYNGDDVILSGSIPPRSIQTVLLDSN